LTKQLLFIPDHNFRPFAFFIPAKPTGSLAVSWKQKWGFALVKNWVVPSSHKKKTYFHSSHGALMKHNTRLLQNPDHHHISLKKRFGERLCKGLGRRD